MSGEEEVEPTQTIYDTRNSMLRTARELIVWFASIWKHQYPTT
ncbi:MAG: hypothetical protein ACE5J2_03310 [Nitrososphaerales archaeon]